MNRFDIPIVLFTFKRIDTTLQILDVIRKIRPSKLYIVSDQGRTEEEKSVVLHVRTKLKEYLKDWNTEIEFDFAVENRGVYENIGIGACKIFAKEEYAIFLEDDNLPAISFFEFCREMLYQYKDNDKVLWICGTNYLGQYPTNKNIDYVFTQQLLPCGWASWSNKFLKYYEKDFSNLSQESLSRIRKRYINKKLFSQQKDNWLSEKNRHDRGEKYFSWDYHMSFSIMYHNLYGIAPKVNLIKNIGVDEFSIHGGTSFEDIMTKRFCGVPLYELTFPIQMNKNERINTEYEEKVSKIILFPLKSRIKKKIVKLVKTVLRLPEEESIHKMLKGENNKNAY